MFVDLWFGGASWRRAAAQAPLYIVYVFVLLWTFLVCVLYSCYIMVVPVCSRESAYRPVVLSV